MSTNTNKKRLGAVAGVTAVALVGGGLAVAYWTTTGSGTGTGTVGTDTPVTVNQTSSVSGLVPGGPAADLDFEVVNTAAGPQSIQGVTIAVTTPAAGCSAADFQITQPNLGAPLVEVPVGTTAFDSIDTGAQVQMLNRSGVNQNGCKNAALTFTYTVN